MNYLVDLGKKCPSQKKYPPDIANQIFQKAQSRIQKLCHLTVPQRLVLQVPQLRGIDPPSLSKALTCFISQLSIPAPLRSFLASTISVVAKKGTMIRDVICNRAITLSMDTMADIAKEPCQCCQLKSQHGLPLVDGHIVARHPDHVRALLGHNAPILLQSMSGETLPSWGTCKYIVMSSLRRLLKMLPVPTPDAPSLFSDCLHEVKLAWELEKCLRLWFQKEAAIKPVKDDMQSRGLVVLPCDKNEGKALVCCRVLYYKKIVEAYGDMAQFEPLAHFPSPKLGKQDALKRLKHLATQSGLGRFWKEGPTSAPPSSFTLPKNKLKRMERAMEAACALPIP